MEGWYSVGQPTRDTAIVDVEAMHSAIFENANASISQAFDQIQKSLIVLQLDMVEKIRNMHQHQTTILQTTRPSQDAIEEFLENVKKISRALEAITAHAENLSHVKLTMARLSHLVSPDGLLDKLVTKRSPSPFVVEKDPLALHALERLTLSSSLVGMC